MTETLNLTYHFSGKADHPAFPEYPQFTPVDPPGVFRLRSFAQNGLSDGDEISPTKVWHGIISPFLTDNAAKLALRLLAADLPLAVHGGTLYSGEDAHLIEPHAAEYRLVEADIAFDVLVAEFEPPAHPWAFSLAPAIFQRSQKRHPHLRSDRVLQLPSRELHAFCVYSSAEFTFDNSRPVLTQFLNQVAIFLGKHIIWQRTQRLFNKDGVIIHDGIDMSSVMRTLPIDSLWSIIPKNPTQWIGYWPGTPAKSGADHLNNDPEKECWCGKGKLYQDCCLAWERAYFAK